jgi:mono/diheme cytochrome c family protein
MPTFNLTDTQVEALTTALLAQTDRAVTMPPELVRSSPRPKYHPGGDPGRLMEDLRCQSCHTINGNGGDMAPDLTFEGSAVRRPWLLDFMKNPNTLRPALIRRMPKFNLSDAEIQGLSDYMLYAYQASGFDSQALDQSTLNADAAARGKQLFYEKYACQSCHVADYKRDKGYVGPALADVGNRLSPVWMYRWLNDPAAFLPGTPMPNFNLTEAEAHDVTAFLTTLKEHKKGGSK